MVQLCNPGTKTLPNWIIATRWADGGQRGKQEIEETRKIGQRGNRATGWPLSKDIGRKNAKGLFLIKSRKCRFLPSGGTPWQVLLSAWSVPLRKTANERLRSANVAERAVELFFPPLDSSESVGSVDSLDCDVSLRRGPVAVAVDELSVSQNVTSRNEIKWMNKYEGSRKMEPRTVGRQGAAGKRNATLLFPKGDIFGIPEWNGGTSPTREAPKPAAWQKWPVWNLSLSSCKGPFSPSATGKRETRTGLDSPSEAPSPFANPFKGRREAESLALKLKRSFM